MKLSKATLPSTIRIVLIAAIFEYRNKTAGAMPASIHLPFDMHKELARELEIIMGVPVRGPSIHEQFMGVAIHRIETAMPYMLNHVTGVKEYI